jgi:hypothetical protein
MPKPELTKKELLGTQEQQKLKGTIIQFLLLISASEELDLSEVVNPGADDFDPATKGKLRRFHFGMIGFIQDILERLPGSKITNIEAVQQSVDACITPSNRETLETRGCLACFQAYQEFINVRQEIQSGNITPDGALPYLLKGANRMSPLDSFKLRRDALTNTFSSLLIQEMREVIDLNEVTLPERTVIQPENFIDKVHKIFSGK